MVEVISFFSHFFIEHVGELRIFEKEWPKYKLSILHPSPWTRVKNADFFPILFIFVQLTDL